MKTRSAKNKGRSLQNLMRDRFREQFKGVLEDGDIESRTMGCSGEDIILSPSAKKLIPFSIECKNVEKLNFWEAIEQAESNSTSDRIPMVVFKKNRKQPYVIVSLDNFMKLIYGKEENNV